MAAALPPFHAASARVTAALLGKSWRPGCPVGPSQLRRVYVSYVGFDGRAHRGELVVDAAVVRDVEAVFSRLYAARFPVHRMRPVSAYGGSDDRSMAADNTSAFNCRYAVAPGPKQWSVHAYGEAVDVNTVENPYVEGGRVLPPAGRRYLNRSRYRRGMAVAGGVLVRAFASVGWFWGGRWTSSPDWQHFSKTGG
ncbi:MAG TPA: M15 family metallopeptidase [Gaiellaceae bacterium]|nr:M15 family metallopeptidase [Gaiellaceae bacterium]